MSALPHNGLDHLAIAVPDTEEALKLWRDQGRFQGGIGLYPTFVHVDTRGTNADW